MADNSQDRNLPASHRKLTKAREDGQIAQSRDLGHFVAIAACVRRSSSRRRCSPAG